MLCAASFWKGACPPAPYVDVLLSCLRLRQRLPVPARCRPQREWQLVLADLTTAEAQYKAAGAASQRDGHSGESQPVANDPAVTVGSTLAVGLSNIAFLRREAAKRLHALVCGVVQCGTSAAQDTAAAVRDVDATAPPA